jgi:DNA-binding MarR family transcriptional regulator
LEKIDAWKMWSLQYQLLMQVIASVNDAVEKLGVDVKELFVLAEIEEHPHPAALAEKLVMPKPTVTVYLKRFEAAGFVKREIDPKDLRKHRLQLTPAGKKIVTRGLAILTEGFGERLDRLAPTEQADFRRLLEKMS